MTTTNSKGTHETTAAQRVTHPEARVERNRRIGREMGVLAVNVYERSIADVVAFEKDAAKIAPPRLRSALTLGAGLVEDVGAAYVKTARAALR